MIAKAMGHFIGWSAHSRSQQNQSLAIVAANPKRLRERLYWVNVMVWAAPAPASGSIESCAKMVVVEQPSEGAPSMGKSIIDSSSVTTVGLDLARHVFQVHGVDASGQVIVAKALRRKNMLAFFAQLPACLVDMEACGSAHHWAHELIKLDASKNYSRIGVGLIQSVIFEQEHGYGRADAGLFSTLTSVCGSCPPKATISSASMSFSILKCSAPISNACRCVVKSFS